MPTPTPINYQKIEIIAIQQQIDPEKKNIINFDVFALAQETPDGNCFEFSDTTTKKDFLEDVTRGGLQFLGVISCELKTKKERWLFEETTRATTNCDVLVIKSRLWKIDPENPKYKGDYTPQPLMTIDCPIRPNISEKNLQADYQKDMLNYAVFRNISKYGLRKKQKVSYFRTYFISEPLNIGDEISYQLNPNQYPFAYSQIV